MRKSEFRNLEETYVQDILKLRSVLLFLSSEQVRQKEGVNNILLEKITVVPYMGLGDSLPFFIKA
jgi:hypothetical protein